MLKHRIFLTIWLLLFIASAFFCVKSAINYNRAKRSFSAMENAVISILDVDFSRPEVYTGDFQHTSPLSPHGETLLADISADDSSLAQILEDAEVHVSICDGEEELYSDRLLSFYHLSGITTHKDGKTYTAFYRLPFHNSPKKYTIKIDVKKPCKKNPAKFSLMAKYDYCGLESMFSFFILIEACLTGFLTLVFLSCVFWRLHLIRAFSRRPSGSKTMYLLTSYPKWSETFIRNDIKHLIADGVHIELYSLFPGNCKMEDDWPKAVILSPESDCSDKPTDSKFSFLPCPRWIRLHFSLLKHRKLLKAIVAECKRNGIGHIHAEFADLAALLGAMAANKTGCAFSIGIHALDIHKLKYPAHALFDGAKFITVCNQNAAISFSHDCPWAKQRLHIIHHGINLQEWPYLEKRENNNTLKIIFCGRLVPKKGVSILIDALDILINHSHNQATLEIIGGGPLEDELKAQVSSLGLDSCVTFAGRLSQTEIREHFAHASCLCAPSIVTKDGDMDGVPNVILEAMATGLPVIGSTAGSLPEVISAETAWPVSEVAPHTIADAILDMASQPAEIDRRRQNARSHIEYRFDAERLGKKRAALF